MCLQLGGCLQSRGKSLIATGPVGLGSLLVEGANLSSSRLRGSFKFFLRAAVEQSRRVEPPDESPR
jgi:hypothetical protein